MIRSVILLFPVLLCASASALASMKGEYVVTKWETDDGLPGNSATAMVQTTDGYLWLGTFNGLVRFDGVRFTVFDPSNTPELPDDDIVNLHLHRSGRLWISTSKGLVTLKDGQWKRVGLNTSWTNRFARTFAENASGVMCATSFDGAFCRLDGDEVIELPRPASTQGQRGYVDPGGTLWAVSAEFFGHWDGQRWVPSDIAAAVTNRYRTATPARDGNLWVLHTSRLLKVGGGKVLRSVELNGKIFDPWSMYEDQDGTLWVAANQSGLYRISQERMVESLTMKEGLSYDALRFAFRDREHNLWVGTSGGGLMRLRSRTFHTLGTDTSLPVRVLYSVAEESPGTMLLGTHGGSLVRLDEKSATPQFLTNLPARFIRCVLVDRQRRIWIGSDGRGLLMKTANEQKEVSPAECGGHSTSALFEDSSGRIWIGGRDSIAVFEDEKFRRAQPAGGAFIGAVSAFAESPSDRSIWAVNHRGLFQFKGGIFQEIKGPGDQPLQNAVCLRGEADGTLWVGTSHAGLLRRRDGVWGAITVRNGLPTDTVSSILDDGLGNLWLGSNRGVVRAAKAAFDAVADKQRTALDCQVFTVSDGLGSVECLAGIQPNAIRDSQGRLWYATMKGVAMADPKRFQLDTNPPPVLIESASFVSRDGARRRVNLESGSPVEVPPGSSQFGARYTALNFSDPQKVRFKHRLLRGDQVLNQTETAERFVGTTLLPPGRYTFEVRAANHHGVWTSQPATLGFTILPFFWQTLWFRVLAAFVALGGASVAVWRVQHSAYRRQREQLAQQGTLAKERARLASVLEGTTDFVGFASPEGRALFVNPAGRRMMGFGENEDLGQVRIQDFHPSATADFTLKTAIPQALDQGTWSGESMMKRRDGGEFPVSQVIVAHKDDQGQLLFFSTIIRDISAQRLASEALQRSEGALRAFMDALPTPAMLLEKDGAFAAANEALARGLGRSRKDLIGKIGYSMLPPDLAVARKAAIDGVFARGQGISFEDSNSGRHYINYLSPVLDAAGAVTRVAVFALDITGRKRAEKEVRESEERFSKAFHASPAIIAISTFPEGRYLDVNAQFTETLGYTREEVLGRRAVDLEVWARPEQRQAVLDQLARGETVRDTECLLRTKAGELRHVLVSVERISLGTQPCLLFSNRDITDRKQAEAIQEAMVSLTTRLSAASTPTEAARVIYETADRFWRWDAGALDLYSPTEERVWAVMYLDLIEGRRREVPPSNSSERLTPRMRRVMAKGPELVLRRPSEMQVSDSVAFGDKARLSASIMSVPIRSHGQFAGVLSIQSYTPNAFTDADLRLLQGLADYCGGTLERIRATQALRQSQEQFQQLFQSSPLATAIYSKRDGRLVNVNTRFLELFQDRPEQVIGRTGLELGIWCDLSARDEMLARLERKEEVRDFEARLRGKDGRELDLLLSAQVIELPDGPMVIVQANDITERKRAEQALRASEARLHAIVHHTPNVAVQGFDLQGRVRLWNDASTSMFGFDADTAMGKTLDQLIHTKEETDKFVELLRGLAGTGKSVGPSEYRFRRRNGEEGWCLSTIFEIPGPGSEPLFVCMDVDITGRKHDEAERQRLLAQLLESEDEAHRRIARELHDGTAQHLAATKLNLTRLRDASGARAQWEAECFADSLALVEKSVQEIRTLTWLLHPPLLDELGLAGALRDYATGFARRSGVQVSVDAGNYSGRLLPAVELALFRVAQEGLANVHRHSGSTAALISLERDAEEVRLEIQDSGRGMAANARVGVGLRSMTERLRQLGGQLDIESDPEGTTVLASVPLGKQP
jgi:PAS domain S-box-containing protein